MTNAKRLKGRIFSKVDMACESLAMDLAEEIWRDIDDILRKLRESQPLKIEVHATSDPWRVDIVLRNGGTEHTICTIIDAEQVEPHRDGWTIVRGGTIIVPPYTLPIEGRDEK